MSTRMTLSDFLRHVGGVYNSIDVRTAAAKYNDTWQNAVTVVSFSYHDPQDVRKEQEEHKRKWGTFETSNFTILMQALHIKLLDTLLDFLKEGRLPIYAIDDLRFERGIDLVSVDGAFRDHGYAKRKAGPYPFFEAAEGPHCALLKEEHLQREVKSETLFDLYPLIAELLEIDFHRDMGFDIIVCAPFYARIEHWDFGEQRCKIQVKFHEDIKALAVTAIVLRGDRDEAPFRDKASSPITLEESEELDEHMRLWTKELDLPNATRGDYLSVSLIQRKPAALDIERPSFPTQIRQLLERKHPAREPLVAAFQRFCSLDELEEYLKNPTKAEPFSSGKKDVSATFELAVAWLLGLCGFHVIWLGQTKHEVIQEDKVTRFSVDIVAHYEAENILLLVGCTTGIPVDKDMDSVKSVRRALLEEVFEDTQVQTKPVVFSAAPELGNKERDGVRVLDAGDIRGILNYVREGDVPRALSTYFDFTFRPKT